MLWVKFSEAERQPMSSLSMSFITSFVSPEVSSNNILDLLIMRS